MLVTVLGSLTVRPGRTIAAATLVARPTDRYADGDAAFGRTWKAVYDVEADSWVSPATPSNLPFQIPGAAEGEPEVSLQFCESVVYDDGSTDSQVFTRKVTTTDGT